MGPVIAGRDHWNARPAQSGCQGRTRAAYLPRINWITRFPECFVPRDQLLIPIGIVDHLGHGGIAGRIMCSSAPTLAGVFLILLAVRAPDRV
jgi:hypothetical protein